MDPLFQRAWGNYVSLMRFLLQADENTWETPYGYFQPFGFATSLSYQVDTPNFNNFLLYNLSNYIGGSKPINDNSGMDDVYRGLSRLEENYEFFLLEFSSLMSELLNIELQKKYEKLKELLHNAQYEFEQYLKILYEKWILFRDENQIPRERWEDARVIWERDRGYSVEIGRLKQEIKDRNTAINSFLRANIKPEYRKLIDAISNFDDEGYMVKLPVSPSHESNNDQRFWQDFRFQFPVISIKEFLERNSEVNHRIKTVSEDYKRVETKWKVSASAKWGLFSGGSSVERRTLEEQSTKQEFDLAISFKNFQNVPIYRGRWYQDVLFTSIGKELEGFWGVNGRLSAIPYSIVLGRGLEINVKIGKEFKEVLEKFISGGGSFGWGPFKGSGSYSRDEKYMQYESLEEGFSLKDDPQKIRVLGSCVKTFNWDDNGAESYYKDLTEAEIIKLKEDIYKDLKKI